MSEELTADELAVFCSKLEKWSESLPLKERAFLEVLLKTASEIGSDLSDADLDHVAGGTLSIAQPTLDLTTKPSVNWTLEDNGATHTDLASGNE
jgi:hypothetical protein